MFGVLLQASQDCRYTAKQYTESMEYNEKTKATAGTDQGGGQAGAKEDDGAGGGLGNSDVE